MRSVSDLHLPLVVRLGTDDRDAPIASSVREHVLDNGDDFGPQRGVARVLHLDFDSHTAKSIRWRR